MNVYSVLPLISLFANLFLAFYILYIDPKKRVNQVYIFIALSLSVWSIAHFYLFNASSLAEANLWNIVATAGAVFSAIFMFHFSLVFAKVKISKIIFLFLFIIYVIGGLFAFAEFNTSLLTQEMMPSYWGFKETPGPGYILLSLFLIVLVLSSIIICYRVYLKSSEQRIKRKTKLVMLAFTIPLIGGIVTQVFFPLLNIDFLPLTSSLSTLTVIIIGISIMRYKLMTPRSFSIQKKIVIMFFVFFFILLFFTLTMVNVISTSNMKETIENNFQAIAQSRANHINDYLETLEDEIKLINTGIGYNELLNTDEENASYDNKYLRVEKRLTNSLSENYYEIFILDRTGKVIISTDEDQIGENKSTDDFFTGGLNQTYIQDVCSSNKTGKTYLAISTPIKNHETNETIGVMVAKVETKKLDEITTDTTGMGESGETFLVNKTGFVITPLRFFNTTYNDNEIILKLKIDNINFHNALLHAIYSNEELEKQHNEVNVYDDYRGKSVFGTHVYFPEMQWVLLCKIDESEAVASVNHMQTILTFILSGFSIILLLVAWYYAKTLSSPIKELDKYAKEIKNGNLDVKINITTGDEIANLADSFNLMADSLKEYTNNLEQRVDERTQELQEKIRELKKFKKVTVGRELKMVELKNEIKHLKEKTNWDDQP